MAEATGCMRGLHLDEHPAGVRMLAGDLTLTRSRVRSSRVAHGAVARGQRRAAAAAAASSSSTAAGITRADFPPECIRVAGGRWLSQPCRTHERRRPRARSAAAPW
uniref:Uncharacterized protein n=1 Tax=Oryza barthii TaxID=65489 RepID=A0A0D3F236_9ORYZ